MHRTLALFAALLLVVLVARPQARGSQGPTYQRHAVAADTTQASEAGLKILQQGGNAADAAAATMLALGVTSPSGSGLGGGGFALYYSAKDGSLTFLDFREQAPAAATPDMFAPRPGDDADQTANRSRSGGLAVGVPGEPAGVVTLVERFGSLPLAKVVEPARALAADGFTLSEHTSHMLAYKHAAIAKDPILAAWPKTLSPGIKLTNPALAKTLARLGSQGRKGFYEGPVAAELLRAIKQHGGTLTAADLKAYTVKERTPVTGEALGYQWVSAPPPSAGGYTLVQSLQLLEHWLPERAERQGVARWHALAEAFKGTYLDRERYFGDPDFAAMPLAQLSAAERVAARAKRFRPQLAQPAEAYDLPLPEVDSTRVQQPDNAGTSHLCVVDAEGNIASVTTTVNLAFGAGFSAAGLWLNDEMDDFAREVGKDNAFGLVGGAANLPAPGKRPVSSMSPSLVMKDDKPVLCIGGSGGSRIITAVAQVALRILEDGMHPAEAVAAPRIHHQGHPDTLQVRDLTDEERTGLRARGHHVTHMGFSASVQAIAIDRDSETPLRAASDPSKGGQPAGE